MIEEDTSYWKPLPYLCKRCGKNKTDGFFCEPCREEIEEKYQSDQAEITEGTKEE